MGSWGRINLGLQLVRLISSPFLNFCRQFWWTNRLNSAGLDITRCGWSFELVHGILKATHLLWLCWWAQAFCPLITLIPAVFMCPMPDSCYTVCTKMALCLGDFPGKIYLCYYNSFFCFCFWSAPHTKPFVFLLPAWISPSHLGFSCIKRWHHSLIVSRWGRGWVFHSSASARLAHAQARADHQKRCMMSCRRSIRAPTCNRFSRKPIVLLSLPSPPFAGLFLFSFCLQFLLFAWQH